MDTLFLVVRAVHVLCGAIWLGQVVVINALILPLIPWLQDESRKEVLIRLFPKLYSMASHISLTVLVTGIFLVYYVTQGNLGTLFLGRWGLSILVGGGLGILLSLFQFYLKKRITRGIFLLKCRLRLRSVQELCPLRCRVLFLTGSG